MTAPLPLAADGLNEALPMLIPFGMILFIIALVVGSVIHHNRWLRKRQEAFLRIAEDRGFDYRDEQTAAPDAIASMWVMSRGRGHSYRNVMTGRTADVDFQSFDYQYRTGSGKNQTTHRHSMFVFESPLLAMPHFTLTPENFGHRLVSMLGYQDIDFDDYPDFSNRYLLRGDDEGAVRAFFESGVLDAFTADGGSLADWNVEAQGGVFLAYPRKMVDADEFDTAFANAFTLFTRFRDASSG